MLGYVRIGYGLTARIGVYDSPIERSYLRLQHIPGCRTGPIVFSLPHIQCLLVAYNMRDLSCR